ncbi:MAG: DegV family protein [Bacillota bacterium]
MRYVMIVTDSTCNLPSHLVSGLSLVVIPIYIIVRGRTFRDGIDISPEQVLELLARGEYPQFSQPAPGDFMKAYRRVREFADPSCPRLSVVSIHVTAQLSGTYNAATLAAAGCSEIDILVVDSGTGSMATGWVALEAARAAAAGADRDSIIRLVRSAIDRTAIFVLIPDLTFLHRAGRLGKAQAWLGANLSLNPIVTARRGVLAPYRLVRGRKRGLEMLVKAAVDKIGKGAAVRAAVVHVAAEGDARTVMGAVRDNFCVHEEMILHAAASVTAGLGPGAVALCLLKEG